MKLTILRLLLLVDAAILLVLGLLLVMDPARILAEFHFQGLPAAVNYLIGLWGCALGTMAFGYVVAATNPLRHRVWIQVAIARGLLECVVGIVYLVRGTVTIRQAAVGVVLAAAMSVAYVWLYPRPPKLDKESPGPAPTPAAPASSTLSQPALK